MFFFKKKKLLEIENMIGAVVENLSITNQRQEEILSNLSSLENRMILLEDKVSVCHDELIHSVNDGVTTISCEANEIKCAVETLNTSVRGLSNTTLDRINSCNAELLVELNKMECTISKSKEESIESLMRSTAQSCELLHKFMNEGTEEQRMKMDSATKELWGKLEQIDSSIKLLLLNSVMDQI